MASRLITQYFDRQLQRYLTVGKLRELLARFPDDYVVYVNVTKNLNIAADIRKDALAFVDLGEERVGRYEED